MKQITFIHAADLHLDSPMVGLKHLPPSIYTKVRESTFTALKTLTETAIKHRVDFVILAGDLFDGEDRSLRAQSRFRTEMLKLSEKEIPVYVVHGNHDHLNGKWVNLNMPSNVHIFTSEVETKLLKTKSGEMIHLYGFSYPERHVFEKKIDEYKKKKGADFHIGLLHGNAGGGQEHDNYAPFSVQDLYEKQFDYWALGHIHKKAILSEIPPIIYPGNIQGRNKKELGVKGCYHVTLTDLEAKMAFVETSEVVWEEATVDASTASSFHDVFQLCQNKINSFRNVNKGTLLTLYLENIQLDDDREKRTLDGELLELLLEGEKDEESFVWMVDLIVSESSQMDKDQLKTEANFYAELFETAEQYTEIGETLAPLYEHHLGRKYLSQLTALEQKELMQNAEKLLIKLLYQ
ncbi:metallophosphoesterase family protein [Neobacillus ginsengisoli]|uniref:DNA repair exonuclease SbcCD nuclease subunit n=1 Tax=Neobacillus ginsengisoli TaxID=904295 RepID=A0ABT9XT31_9BACI|nr:DNA repair exonuclease [Neobacillus ginsengisoli]MDQ0198104.1 DNA repair exonuclease SbcCD nuclease subunit [Neobacillus ginsengisoli]